ncbi:hypothetical protein WS57_05490 [Burkholderia pseudomultivorans]|nr:hypothetical protein WS57_05490 [Burkholderia pseudomultivorans]
MAIAAPLATVPCTDAAGGEEGELSLPPPHAQTAAAPAMAVNAMRSWVEERFMMDSPWMSGSGEADRPVHATRSRTS